MTLNYYLIFGRANAGKTTYARHVLLNYLNAGIPAVIIDGDCMRNLYNNNDYSDHGRQINLQQCAALAKAYMVLGIVPIIAVVCPKVTYRMLIRNIIGDDKYLPTLVYIEGGELWEGTDFEEPDENEEFGYIRIPDWRLNNG